MGRLAWHVDQAIDAARAYAKARGAIKRVGSGQAAFVYGAELIGDAIAVGAHQRIEDAVADATRAQRRTTGGPAAFAGAGIGYLAIAMAHGSVFMACPRDRVLNRNVRGLLGGLRAVGFAAHYFGRDNVAVSKAPAALLAWTRWPDERVLLEIFVGLDRSYALREHGLLAPAAPTREPIALRDERPLAFADLVHACARSYAAMGSHESVEAEAPAEIAFADPMPTDAAAPLRWSAAREIPIGWLRAGLATDARGIVIDAALAGDFYQDFDAPARLRAALVGGAPDPERLRDALNATYGAHGAVIEGIRSLQPALEAFLELT